MFSAIIHIIVLAIGLMMGLLYKRTITTASFFNPDPKIAMRVFMYTLVLGILITFALSWYCMHAMQPSGIFEENDMLYKDVKSVMYFSLNLFFLLLVISANLYSQSLKKLAPVPYLIAFLFYTAFVLKDGYFISTFHDLWYKAWNKEFETLTDYATNANSKVVMGFISTTVNAFSIWWGLRK